MHDYEGIPNSVIEHTINEYIHSERDRIILKDNLIDGLTYQQISDHLFAIDKNNRDNRGIITNYSLCPKQIGRRILKLEKELFKHLTV